MRPYTSNSARLRVLSRRQPRAADQAGDQLQGEVGALRDVGEQGFARVTTTQVAGSSVSTLAERGPPSSDISPIYSPAPYMPSVISLPLSSAA